MARLGDVCKLVSGNSLPETIVAEKGELPYVKVAELNLAENTPNITTSRQFVSATDISAKQIVPVGTVIFPKRGGAIGTNKKRLVSIPICMDLNLMGVIPSSKLYPQYLYYFFENIDMGALSNGSSVPQINNSDIAPLEIRIPVITTQKDIATRLDKVTELIALRKEQLAKLDQLVKSRFIELFGDPNTNPMGWEKEQLQVNATLLNGRAYKQDELLDDGRYPVLRVGNFFSNRGWYYSDLELEEDKYCDNGDLLYAWSASFGPKIWNGGKVIYHYHIWKVLVGKKYNKQFLCNLLDYATASFMGDTHGIGMMHLTKSGMEQTEFIIPPIVLQEQFAAFVEQTDKSKLAIQQSLDKLELLKKSLMQEYFG